MGQEAEYEQRVRDFAGYQVTEALCREGGAHPDWKFMHCLPRKKHEVNDEVRTSVFYTSYLTYTQLMDFWRSFTVLALSCSQKPTTGSGQLWRCLSA
jgi:ornithine carbamoyltransferase